MGRTYAFPLRSFWAQVVFPLLHFVFFVPLW